MLSCTLIIVNRGELIFHLLQQCPNELLACPLLCGDVVLPAQLEAHFQERQTCHLNTIYEQLMTEHCKVNDLN